MWTPSPSRLRWLARPPPRPLPPYAFPLAQLIAAVGGVELDFVEYPFVANGASAADKLKAGTIETAHTTAAREMGMEGCGLPIMTHGDLKFHQSFAVQTYVASIGPNFPTLTPKQVALDTMFQGSLEDMMGLAAGVILSGYEPTLVPKFMTKSKPTPSLPPSPPPTTPPTTATNPLPAPASPNFL